MTKLRSAVRVLLVGAPGVGKGTQTERLLKRYPQLASIASGDLLRANVRHKTSTGLEAAKLMKAGSLVPDEMILKLILDELRGKRMIASEETSGSSPPTTTSSPNGSFILDGFPRTATQARLVHSNVPINLVVSLHTPHSIILSRISSRWVHAPSGRVYNTEFNAPKVTGKDDVTGEPLTKRDDDSEETWRERLRAFEETSRPLLDFYEKKGVLWTVEGNSSDEISPKLFAEIDKRFT